MSETRYRVFAALSTVPQTLQAADELLSLARKHDASNRHPLAACAAVMLASALAQAIHLRLRMEAKSVSFDAEVALEDTTPWRLSLQGVPFRKKLLELPEVCSQGHFELRRNAPQVRALVELVALRNRLMHIEEEPTEHDLGTADVQRDADSLKFSVVLPVPTDPWASVTIKDAERFRRAVTEYIDAVAEIGPDRYAEGPLLRRRT